MSEFIIRGRFNPRLLSEELRAAFPQIVDRTVDPAESLYSLAFDEIGIRFRSDLRIDEKAFLAVIAAHNPNGKSRNERREERYLVVRDNIRLILLDLFTEEELGFLLRVLGDEQERSAQALARRE